MKTYIINYLLLLLSYTACTTEISIDITSNTDKRQCISESKHFLVENDAVCRYLNEVQYNGFKGSVISEYAVESGYRMDWPREFSLSMLSASISPDATLSYKIWKYSTDELLFEGEGSVSQIERFINYLQPGDAYVYELIEPNLTLSFKDTLQLNGQVRMIKCDNTSNIRDIGGWNTRNGNRVRYGRLFRGGCFRTVSERDRSLIIDQLGISVEIDLRSYAELHLDDDDPSNDLNYSVLGDGISYYSYPMPLSNFINENDVYVKVFRTVLSSLQLGRNIYIHCAGGADRTGTIIMMLEAILDLTDSNMAKDYELTSFAPLYYDKDNYRTCNNCTKTFDHFSSVLGKTGTTNELATLFLLSQGITQEEIDSFRNIMLESNY